MAIALLNKVNNSPWSWKLREGFLLSSPASHRQTQINLLCLSKSSKFTCQTFANPRSLLSNSSIAIRNQKDTPSPFLEQSQLNQQSSTLVGLACCNALKSIMKHQAAALLLFGLLLIRATCPCYPALAVSRPAVGFNSSSSSTCYDDNDNESDQKVGKDDKGKNMFCMSSKDFMWVLNFLAFERQTSAVKIQVGYRGPVESITEEIREINRQVSAKTTTGYAALRRALLCLLQYSEYRISSCFCVEVEGNPKAAYGRFLEIIQKEYKKFESLTQAPAGNSKIKSHSADRFKYTVVTIFAMIWDDCQQPKINDSRDLDEALQVILSYPEPAILGYYSHSIKLSEEELDQLCMNDRRSLRPMSSNNIFRHL